MPKIYKCEKCNKYFNKKDHLITHINRKFPCVNPNNISCYTIKDAVEINEDLPSSFFTNELNENLPLKPPKKPQVIKQNENPDIAVIQNENPDIAVKKPIIAVKEPIIAVKDPENPDIAENETEKIPLLSVLNDTKNKLTIGDEYDANNVNINVENLDHIETLKTEFSSVAKEIEPKTEFSSVAKEIEPKTEFSSVAKEIEPKTEFSSVAKEIEPKTEHKTELKNVYGEELELTNTKIKKRLFSKKDYNAVKDEVLNKKDITITDTHFELDNIHDITPPIKKVEPPKPLQTKSVFITDDNTPIEFDEFTKSKMYLTDLANIKRYGKKKSVKNYRPRHILTPRTNLRNLKNKTKEETRPKTKKQNILITKTL